MVPPFVKSVGGGALTSGGKSLMARANGSR